MSERTKLVIGTRGSKLALWQSEYIKAKLEEVTGLPVELKIIKTTGDKILDVPLAKVGGKGLFTKELEVELLAGTVDLCVHSMKDVPTELPESLYIAAMPERVDPRDAIVSGAGYNLDTLPQGAKLGTSSLRRRSQVKALRPDLEIVDVRGNLDTRMTQGRERRARRGHPGECRNHPYGLGRAHHALHRPGADGLGRGPGCYRHRDPRGRRVHAPRHGGDRPPRDHGVRHRRARGHEQARRRLPGADRRVRTHRGRPR